MAELDALAELMNDVESMSFLEGKVFCKKCNAPDDPDNMNALGLCMNCISDNAEILYISKCPKCNSNIVENDGDLICENKECRYCIEPPPIPVELYDVMKDINSNADILPFS